MQSGSMTYASAAPYKLYLLFVQIYLWTLKNYRLKKPPVKLQQTDFKTNFICIYTPTNAM